MRSRTGSLPRSRWRSIERSSPAAPRPRPRLAARSSSTSAAIASWFARVSGASGSSRVRRTGMAARIARRKPRAGPSIVGRPCRRLAAPHSARPPVPRRSRSLAAGAGCPACASSARTRPVCRSSPSRCVAANVRTGRAARPWSWSATAASTRPRNRRTTSGPCRDQVAAIDAAIKLTDFAMRKHPFTGECPTAFDGEELVYEFSAPTGVERMASCEVEVDLGAAALRRGRECARRLIPLPLT